MIVKKVNSNNILSSEITSEADYLSRRRFLGRAGAMVAAATLAACTPKVITSSEGVPTADGASLS